MIYMAVAGMGPEGLFRDSDTGWHIVTGERIFDTWTLPRVDPYSFTKPGEPWYAWEWLADVAMGALHKWKGLAGVALGAVVVLAAAAWMWCAFALWLGADAFIVAALMTLASFASASHWHARPHLISWVFLIAWVWLLEQTPSKLSVVRCAGLFVLMMLWVNLHGSFFLAFFLAGAYGVEFWFRDRRRASTLAVEVIFALVATFCNPYGSQLHAHLARYLTNTEMLAFIREFQSLNFHGFGGIISIALFLLAISGAGLCFQQGHLARGLVILMLSAIALRSARGIPLVAFVALPLSTAAITRALTAWKPIEVLLSESNAFRNIERQATGALFLLLAAGGLFFWYSTGTASARARFPAERLPVQAAEALDRLDPSTRLFAPDYFGGYIIYRFSGKRKVFFDGRSDFYGTQFVKDYVNTMAMEPGWRKKFGRFQFTHALLPEDHALREALECLGWQRLYGDSTAVLLEHPKAAPAHEVCSLP
ncbi:MAG: hypothetical protein WHT08_01375 [Bryobacteraceae bacterium]